MKLGKAAGPSGVVADMLKAAGEDGTRWMTELCNAVVRDGKIPKDWSRSWLVNVYKEKGDALECGSYTGIKLVEHATKILERVIERRVIYILDLFTCRLIELHDLIISHNHSHSHNHNP